MNLSENFTLDELCVTDTGAANLPDYNQKDKLLYVAQFLLQPMRTRWGKIHVNSAFRSEFVNEKIGGALTSQHKEVEAADCVPQDAVIDDVFAWAKKNLVYWQIILEHHVDTGARWIHISLPRMNGANMQAMTCEVRGKEKSYTPA